MKTDIQATRIPGAPRPDLERLLNAHARRCGAAERIAVEQRDSRSHWRARYAAYIHADAMAYTTVPDDLNDIGTELRRWADYAKRIEADDDAERVLRNHRRMAHRAWVRAVEQGDCWASDELGAHRAWLCARLHCGLEV